MTRKKSDVRPDPWRSAILHYINDHPDRPLKARALARAIDVPDDEYADYKQAVRALVAEGTVVYGNGRTLSLPDREGAFVGTFRANPRGFGFIELENHADLFVPRPRVNGAREGDTVLCRRMRGRGDLGPRGEVVKILERKPIVWVGVLERAGTRFVVVPHGKMPHPPVTIEDPGAKAAQPGDLVVVQPLEDTLDAREIRGVIIERLGEPSDTQVLIRGVARQYALPDAFPEEVQYSAADIAKGYREDEPPTDREDLTSLRTITIDPRDARDFDDAISIERTDDGGLELGVHIADVSHFVTPNSPLDREARERGNSAYFPGLVIPMLPEVLSNGVCSLQPERVRLTKSAFITYDRHGVVRSARFSKSYIRSNARLTYEQASAILEGKGDKGFSKDVVDLLKQAEGLARRIRRRRLKAGMLVLNIPDVEIELDEQRNVCDAHPEDTSFSHTLIEMFMVEANEAVCRALFEADLPHIRRQHPPPEPEAGEGFIRLCNALGLNLPPKLDRKSIKTLLDEVDGRPEQAPVNYQLLRSLAQASYGVSTEGHWALASEHYAHFTSPIRRYPDLTVHRMLDVLIEHGGNAKQRAAESAPSEAVLAETAHHCNATERRAVAAERETNTLLLLRLMRGKLGEVFSGVITGVTSFGAFVQLQPVMAEGLIRVDDFGPDYWHYDEHGGRFIGQRSSRVVSLGQAVRVEVAAIDEERREMALIPEDPHDFGRVATDPFVTNERYVSRRKMKRGKGRKLAERAGGGKGKRAETGGNERGGSRAKKKGPTSRKRAGVKKGGPNKAGGAKRGKPAGKRSRKR